MSTASQRFAFATLVTTDDYLPAALVLAHSLRQAHARRDLLSPEDLNVLQPGRSAHDDLPQLGSWKSSTSSRIQRTPQVDLVVFVTPDTLSVQSIRVLSRVYDRVIGVEIIGFESIIAMQQRGQINVHSSKTDPEAALKQNLANLSLLDRSDLGFRTGAPLTKLHAWRLQEYAKVLYLDADTLVLQPVAHLFASLAKFAACSDTGWPDIFNSGVMLLTPSQETFLGLLELAAAKGSWDGADQGLINDFFGGEVGSTHEGPGGGWTRLPFIYNTTALGGYMYAPAFRRHGNRVRIAHFIGDKKPWRTAWPPSASTASRQAQQGDMSAKWWDIYRSFYPVSGTSTPTGGSRSSGVKVRFTDHGVEVIDEGSSHNLNIPVYQAAWDASDISASSRPDAVSDQVDRGRYESLPLFGRLDLLAPALMTTTTETRKRHTDGHRGQDTSSAGDRNRQVTWDATVSSPPRRSSPESHQMRNPPDTYFPNAWDGPQLSYAEAKAEAERRRQFFNPNLFVRNRDFGYIPPEAKEIHTFGHLGGEKPDRSKISAVFPWEESSTPLATPQQPFDPSSGSQRRLSHTPGGRYFPEDDVTRQGNDRNDPSMTGSLSARVQASRRFDNYIVAAGQDASVSPVLPSSASMSGSEQQQHSSMPVNLVQRYTNAWDAAPSIAQVGSRIAQGRIDGTHQQERAQENQRRGVSSTRQGRRSRAGTLKSARAAVGSSDVLASNGTTSGSGGDGAPGLGGLSSAAYYSATSGMDEASQGTASRSRRGGSTRAGSTGYVSTTGTGQYFTPAASGADSTASDYDLNDSIADEKYLNRQLGISGAGTGYGEVEGSSSWSRNMHDFVRLGHQGGVTGGNGHHSLQNSGQIRGSAGQVVHQFGRTGESGTRDDGGVAEGGGRYGGSEEDGDDESSGEEGAAAVSSRRRRFGGGGASTSGGDASSSQGRISQEAGAIGSTGLLDIPGVAYDEDDWTGEAAREGPGYTRRAQASSFVRSHATPRSPRHSYIGLSGGEVGALDAAVAAAGGTTPTAAGSPPEPVAPAPALTGRARIKPEGRSGPSQHHGGQYN